MLTLRVCTVESPSDETRWVKARAELGEHELIVSNRKGVTLKRVEADRVSEGEGRWRYGDVTVTDTPKACGCGGTRTVSLS